MSRMTLRRIMLSFLLVLATTVSVAAKTPHARTPPQPRAAQSMNFDGRWSVVVITDAGTCDRAYRYGVRISGGRIYYEGDTGVQVSGQVDPRGNVSVSLRYGESRAQGSGHLSESGGEGRWQGASATAGCSGRWEAERRD